METSKSLKTIQTVFKVVKVISIIVLICSIIGAVGCAIGIVTLSSLGSLAIDGKTLEELIVERSGENMGTMIANMTEGVILCAAEAVLAAFAKKYCVAELNAGTPFTFEGAKQLRDLSLLVIFVSLGAAVVAAIAYAVVSLLYSDVGQTDFEVAINLGTGLMLLFLSVVFKHGAEVAEKNKEDPPVLE
ncbi:MAG: hypothetical protein J5993_02035 [Clostridia bacterium]|nr:hypothetical protein [Clostridia bacterium]